jgi:tetratricopeptide (TPR) repeat protein
MLLFKRLAAFGVCLATAVAPLMAQGPQADATLPLFTMMAAASLASGDTGPYQSELSKQLRKDSAGKDLGSVGDIRRLLNNAKADYTRLVSFALVIEGPPDFRFRFREADLPREVTALTGLNELLAQFYAEAGVDKLWEKYRAAIDEQAYVYQEGIARVMLEVNGYLRSPTAGFLGRNFSVYIDLMGPPNQVNARSFGADYFIVVAPSPQPQLDEVRHGYLHYVLEPLAAKHAALLREREKLLETAQRAPALDPALRSSFPLFLGECLIRAAELRMTKLPEPERVRRAEDAAQEGYFLTPYFAEALLKFELQEAGIRLYYPSLIEKLDIRREEKRAEPIAFRSAPAPRTLAEITIQRRLPEFTDDVERLLAEAEDHLAAQDLGAARRAYQGALERSAAPPASNPTGRSRALYGLALVAIQEKRPELAKTFFQQTLEAAREPQLQAWSHIYLGRLLDMENRREQAVRHYRQALETGDIAPNARQAAQRGLEAPFRKEDAGKPEVKQ